MAVPVGLFLIVQRRGQKPDAGPPAAPPDRQALQTKALATAVAVAGAALVAWLFLARRG